MPRTQIAIQYDGSFAGFLSCVFYCYVNQEEPVQFLTLADPCCSLYPLRTVETDRERARQVYRSLLEALGREGRELAVRGFLTCLPDREVWLWRLIEKGRREGPSFARDLTDPVVDRVRKAVRHLEHEAELLRGFVRFSELEGALVGEIGPKNRVLPLLRPHFCARFPQETFLLHDATHQEVLLHRPGRWTILPVEDFQMGPPGEEELAWRGLWRSFYHTISIQERYNPKCRMTHMPKRYWGYMTEFQEDRPLTPALRTAPDGRRPAPAGDSPGG